MKINRLGKIYLFSIAITVLCMLAVTMPKSAFAVLQIPTGPKTLGLNTAVQNPTPDYYTTPNWANSYPMAKFVDTLPGIDAASANNLGQYIPKAVPDQNSYPGSDYYVIGLVEYTEKMHSDLNPTTLRGYVQLNDDGANGKNYTRKTQPHYLGPIIVAERDRPVRIKFVNMLPSGAGGDLFIPLDKTVTHLYRLAPNT